MSSRKCVTCGRTHIVDRSAKVECCGQPLRIVVSGTKPESQISQSMRQAQHNLIRHCKLCEHWGARSQSTCKQGCTKFSGSTCQSVREILAGSGCFDTDNPRFDAVASSLENNN